MNKEHKDTKNISLFITYAVVSIILFFILFIIYGFQQVRRDKIEMYRLIEHQGQALIQSMEIAWQNAIISDSVVRKLVAERLLDNAYLIDRLMALSLNNPLFLKELVRETHIFRIIVTDGFGRFISDSQSPMNSPTLPPIPKMPYDSTEILRMVSSILYGKQKQLTSGLDIDDPFKNDLLWVAVARRETPGAIIIIVQADYINRFRSEIGLPKIIKEIGSKPGIEYLVYEDPFNRITNQKGNSGPSPLPKPIFNYLDLKECDNCQITKSLSGKDVLEIRSPLSLGGKNIGLIRIGLPLSKLKESERSMRSQALWFGSLIIIFGILGILAIFYYQYRRYHYEKIREEEIQKTDKLVSIGKLAAGVAHEIRNPLNAISMAIQRLQHEFLPQSEEDSRDFLHFTDVMRDEIKRVDKIITEFLNFTKKSQLAKTKTHLSHIIDDLLVVLEGEAEKNNVVFEKDILHEEEKEVLCDPDQIKQSLINIIRNAIQAMPHGGKVTLSLEFAGNEALVKIVDTGPGLDESQIDKIFEFYYTDKEGGIGLGLPICKKIIEDHGGRIEVESEPGSGSTFILHLPLK